MLFWIFSNLKWYFFQKNIKPLNIQSDSDSSGMARLFTLHDLFMIKHKFLDGALEMQLFLLIALLLFSPFVCNVEKYSVCPISLFFMFSSNNPEVWYTLS